MNREDFMKELKEKLKYADYGTVSEIVNDYEEYFAHGLLEGKTEDEICKELGTPEQIIDNLTEEGVLKGPYYKKKSVYREKDFSKDGYNIIGIIGLIALNFFLICMIVLPIGGGLLGVGIGFILASIPTLIFSIYCLAIGLIFPFFVCISIAAFMILVLIGIYFLIKAIIPLVKKYITWNVKVARG